MDKNEDFEKIKELTGTTLNDNIWRFKKMNKVIFQLVFFNQIQFENDNGKLIEKLKKDKEEQNKIIMEKDKQFIEQNEKIKNLEKNQEEQKKIIMEKDKNFKEQNEKIKNLEKGQEEQKKIIMEKDNIIKEKDNLLQKIFLCGPNKMKEIIKIQNDNQLNEDGKIEKILEMFKSNK